MKTYLTYGFYMAIGSALVIFALYFLGYHEDAAKLGTAQLVQTLTGLVIGLTCVVLGTRNAAPPCRRPRTSVTDAHSAPAS